MKHLGMISAASLALFAAGCVDNGTTAGKMVVKCYYDETVTETLDDDSTVSWTERHVFNSFEFPLDAGETTLPDATEPTRYSTTVIGRINIDNELQLSTFIECKENCRLQCGETGVNDADGNPVVYGAVDLERLTVHAVAGRKEEALVAEDEWELYSPAYFLARGPATSGGGCADEATLEELLDVSGNVYGDPEAYADAQLNNRYPVFNLYDPDLRDADTGCAHYTWGQISVDDPSLVYKRGDISGSYQIANMDVILPAQQSQVLVYVHGDTEDSPATFTIDGLRAADPLLDTVVTENNDVFDLGL